MSEGLSLAIVERDPDYLGVEIRAWSERYAGTTFVFSSANALSEFANRIEGFPAATPDERVFEFGVRRTEGYAGGFCWMRFVTTSDTGAAIVEVDVEEDVSRYSTATAAFAFGVGAAAVDRFVSSLRALAVGSVDRAVLSWSD